MVYKDKGKAGVTITCLLPHDKSVQTVSANNFINIRHTSLEKIKFKVYFSIFNLTIDQITIISLHP